MMSNFLVMCCLVGVALAQPLDDQKEQGTALENTARTLTGPVGQIVTATFIITVLVVSIIYFAVQLFNAIVAKLGTKEEPEPDTYYSYTSRAVKDSIMTQVLNSIDPVDMSFRFMEVEDIACRKRKLCELSATPVIGQLVRYISPSVSSLNEYQDAMSAGEALEDCALLFAECRENQYFNRK